MGAGSAKGRPNPGDDDDDRLSGTSSGRWGNNSDDEYPDENDKSSSESDPPRSPAFDPGPSISGSTAPNGLNHETEEPSADKKGKGENKRRFGFNFSKRQNNEDKPVDENDDHEETDKKKNNKKDGDKKSGFKIFGWRNKKAEEENQELDQDIDDLEKTFDSLGIVGKNMWGEENGPSERKQAVDDLELLEPMRKRKNVRVRGTRGINGTVAGGDNRGLTTGKNSNNSSGSRRTFRYSWETADKKVAQPDAEDEWEYKAVVIEGFDIDKFRKANKKDTVFDSTSLPNAVSGEEFEEGKPMLRYDQNEQQILASIERDFTFN